MADHWGQIDNGYKGGSGVWDDGLAGQILLADYFEAPPPAGDPGLVKYWTGAAWVAKPLKYWTGAAWVAKPLKYWTGAAWVEA